MRLEGIHHVTAITADAPRNVDFYTRVLGLRLVKKTVNQDDPTVYHLFYADEQGSPGSDITFFEYPGLPRGQAGPGMVHRVSFRVASEEALSFWVHRLADEGVDSELDGLRLRFADPEGMGLELASVETSDEPLTANHPEIPAELALQGFDGVRAYATEPDASRAFLEEALAFEPTTGSAWEARGGGARLRLRLCRAPAQRGRPGAGTDAMSPGPRRWTSTKPGASASRRQEGARRRSSTASTSGRSTSASRAASSSRSLRSGRASRQTSPSSRSVKLSRCRPRTSRCGSGSSTCSPRSPTLARHGPPR